MVGKKQRNKSRVPAKESPRIVELDNLQDFKDYVGHKDIPEKTLLQQIEETQNAGSKREAEIRARRKILHPGETSEEDDDELNAVGRFMFASLDYTAYMIPLISVHLVLNILVRLQYGQEAEFSEIARESLATIPVLLILYKLVHPYRGTAAFKVVSFIASIFIGAYLVYATNEEGYYYIMQRAPPLGTLWVWLFIEMEWHWSTVSLLAIIVWMWYKDYKL
ncbi:hypothetical protein TRICI_002605 [Trichomonascus ciferrii]|uniref:DUF7719 domain-containing protein n=1 Tax=Trichomonascus ciferrii TaxID=44093 RepID=A0A642V5G2_9ASCO|nr:hypothetical protein TRICI_002605 [Trichomonascus ciferrii]